MLPPLSERLHDAGAWAIFRSDFFAAGEDMPTQHDAMAAADAARAAELKRAVRTALQEERCKRTSEPEPQRPPPPASDPPALAPPGPPPVPAASSSGPGPPASSITNWVALVLEHLTKGGHPKYEEVYVTEAGQFGCLLRREGNGEVIASSEPNHQTKKSAKRAAYRQVTAPLPRPCTSR